MRLTAFTDYSLRVLIYLGTNPDRRATIAEVAQTFGISESHLTKVVHFLGLQGWLANVRGKGGGMQLALEARHIVIGRVVRATEGEAVPALIVAVVAVAGFGFAAASGFGEAALLRLSAHSGS